MRISSVSLLLTFILNSLIYVKNVLAYSQSSVPRPKFRLLLGTLGIDEVPLYQGYGTHFSYIYVGSPPQRVSVIIDTGSHFTAFPCLGCRNCGTHTDPYYNWEKSSTSKITNCNECSKNTCTNNKCTFSQSYTEGSSWQAFKMHDKVWFGAVDDTTVNTTHSQAFAIDFMFGCQTTETGLFRTQLPDGIMGMSAQPETLMPQLKAAGLIDEEIFSLCFSATGGVMSIGGVDDRLHLPSSSAIIDYVPMVRSSGWFTIKLLDILIDSSSIGGVQELANGGKGVIVDSGTTDTYLPRSIASRFKSAWEKATKLNLSTGRTSLTQKQYDDLPAVIFVFENNVKVKMSHINYMEKVGKDSYEWRIFLTEASGAVLGANFMNDHDVVFDRDGKRVGFVTANCDYHVATNGNKHTNDTVKATPAPTASHHHHDEPVDCEMSTFMPSSSCSAVCPNLSGFQSWSVLVLQEPLFGGKSCPKPLPVQNRPCFINCTSTINDNNVTIFDSCPTGLFSLCRHDCTQERMTGMLDLSGSCSFVHESRYCHSGSCPVGEGDYGIFIKLSLTQVKVHDWNFVVDEEFVLMFCSAVDVDAGNAEILNVEQTAAGVIVEMEIRIVKADSVIDTESRSEEVYKSLMNGSAANELEMRINDPTETMFGLLTAKTPPKSSSSSSRISLHVDSVVFDVLTSHSEVIVVDQKSLRLVAYGVTACLFVLMILILGYKRVITSSSSDRRKRNTMLFDRVYELINTPSSLRRRNVLPLSQAEQDAADEVVPLTSSSAADEE